EHAAHAALPFRARHRLDGHERAHGAGVVRGGAQRPLEAGAGHLERVVALDGVGLVEGPGDRLRQGLDDLEVTGLDQDAQAAAVPSTTAQRWVSWRRSSTGWPWSTPPRYSTVAVKGACTSRCSSTMAQYTALFTWPRRSMSAWRTVHGTTSAAGGGASWPSRA